MTRTSTSFASMPRSARLYVAGVMGAAAAAILASALLGPWSNPRDWAAWLALSLAAALAQLLVVRTEKNQSYHLTITFVVASALVLPPGMVALLVLVQHGPEWVREKYTWYIAGFNIANYVLDALLAAAMFGLISDETPGRWAAGAMTAAFMFVLANHLLLAIVLKLGRGHSMRSTGLFSASGLATDLACAVLGVALTFFVKNDAWLVPAAVLPLLLVYRSMRIPALHRAESRQARLISYGLSAVADAPPDRLLAEALAVACEVLGADCGYLIENGKAPRVRCEQNLRLVGNELEDELMGATGAAMAGSLPVLVEDFAKEERFAYGSAMRRMGAVSALIVPIPGWPASLGAMAVFTTKSRSFALDDVQFLQGLSAIAAAVVSRERAELALHESEERRQALLDDMLRAEEEERLRIATELHDDTIQVMTASLLELDTLTRTMDSCEIAATRERIVRARGTLGEAVERTRRLTFELRPPLLEASGLSCAVEELAEQSGRDAGFRSFVRADVDRYPFVIEDLTYRIMREALSNVRKHAHARTVHIRLWESRGRLHGSVRDDGVGFDVNSALDRRRMRLHLGLDALIERVRLAGGDVRISSRPGNGSRLTFSFPLDHEEHSRPAHGLGLVHSA